MGNIKSYLSDAYSRFLQLGVSECQPLVAERIRAAQIAAVVSYTPWMMAANIGLAVALMIVFWGSTQLNFVMGWAAAVNMLCGMAFIAWFKRRHKPARSVASVRVLHRATLNAALLGSLWGLLPAVTFATANVAQQTILVAQITGMICGSSFALATIPSAAITFSFIVTFGSIIVLFLSPSLTTSILAALTLGYVAVVIKSAMALCNTLTARIVAQITSEDQRDVIGLLLNDFEENATDWLWSVDENLCFRHVSAHFSRIVGLSEQQLVGLDATRLNITLNRASLKPDERRNFLSLLRALKLRKAFRDIDIPVRLQGESLIWSMTAKPVYRSNGEFDGYRGVCRDVTSARQAHREIEKLARFDVLTGLPNRSLFKIELAEALIRLERRGEPFAVLLLDLDHFKFVNDTQGHPVGDALLQQVAKRLKGLVRDIDTIARLGGDEFAIVFSSLEKPQQAACLAERIGLEISKPYALKTGEVRIGVSIGIAYAPGDGDNIDTLIRHADLALYSAKNDGRGGYHFFEPSLDAAARRRHMLENDLRQALTLGALELYYQPLVDPHTRQAGTFEALMRWNHATLGMLNPAEFIALAEEVGLIQSLGAWALHEACAEAMTWPENIRVSVNLSAVQFGSPGLFLEVKAALEKSGLRPDRLELEITESLLLDATESVQAMLTALKSLGVRISLDDFGTGYSSLSYLCKYKFDKIKVDKFFVQGIENDPDSLAIIDALTRLARDMKMALTVEGVETEGQLSALVERGCGEIQGYLISKPMPASRVQAFLENSGAIPRKAA